MKRNSDSGTESSGGSWLAFVLVCAGILALSWSLPGRSFRRYPERKPVIFWHRWTGEWEKVVDGICDRFNESQTDYEVIPLSVPDSMADSKFLIAVAGAEEAACDGSASPKQAMDQLVREMQREARFRRDTGYAD